MKYSSPWNIDPTLGQRLIAWRREGISFQDISTRLGMTRNSCIGWARRNGLATSNGFNTRKSRAKTAESISPPAPEPDPMPELIPSAPVRLVDAKPGQCRYPLWNDAERLHDFLMCGAPTVEGTSWCESHKRRVFSMTGPRKDLAA